MRWLALLLVLSCEVDEPHHERPEDQKIDEKCWYTKDLQQRRDCQLVYAKAEVTDGGVD